MALVPFPSAPRPPSPDDDPRPDLLNEADELDDAAGKMSFLEHLDELRHRLIASVIAIAVGCVIAFIFIGRIFRFVMLPLQQMLPDGGKLITTQGPELFLLYLKVGALAGLILATPFVLWELWLFIAPGLYAHEKRLAIPFVLMSTFFVIAGAAFSHYVAFPWTWNFFIKFTPEFVQFLPRVGDAFSLYVKMLLGFAVIFQMPTLVFFLARMRVISARFLIRNFKYAVLIIFILGAVLSPGGDVVSQALMAGPMLALYGLSIVIAWMCGRQTRETS
jgi:sec-independent protein translocase protein TatC